VVGHSTRPLSLGRFQQKRAGTRAFFGPGPNGENSGRNKVGLPELVNNFESRSGVGRIGLVASLLLSFALTEFLLCSLIASELFGHTRR